MGRELKRVPLDFAWPLKQTWWGFRLPPVVCQLCDGTGKRPVPGTVGIWGWETEYCDVCEGEGKVYPQIPIPEGQKAAGYQMWETTSEGSPISPVFATPEELARWLADTGASAFAGQTATYEQWLGMIRAGSAPSMIADDKGLRSGVEFIGDREEA